ncbi:hypothetical protein [Pilimelia terevasa]|uniref:hypothetical protein n=1 Tax=Pilimelia terevasa TaxID=53372 RepID=UPI001E4E07B5|nr:hypothetical protein [Pilimelia terevasa]
MHDRPSGDWGPPDRPLPRHTGARPPGTSSRHRVAGRRRRRPLVLGTMLACAFGLVVAVVLAGVVPGTTVAGRDLAANADEAAIIDRNRQDDSRRDNPEASRGQRRAAPALSGKPAAKPVRPVAGLSSTQMANAQVIVLAARKRKLPSRAMLVGLMTAMQETNLRNLANPGVPASLRHQNDGTGTDHDSVGVFQQRPSQGWGSVAELMDPHYAAGAFFGRLERTPGWEKLPLTRAAQTVQRSAFPSAYAKHETKARKIVAALA